MNILPQKPRQPYDSKDPGEGWVAKTSPVIPKWNDLPKAGFAV
jgi:hypothetical protein